MNDAFQIFLLGAAASFGPCLLHCSSVVLPYIAASDRTWKQSVASMGIFLAARICIYTLLGLAAGALGRAASIALHTHQDTIMTVGGLVIIGFALLIILGYDPGHRLCRRVQRVHHRSRVVILITMAAVMGPCASLAGMLAFTALASETVLQGGLFGLAFGLGKAFSPLLPLAAAAGLVSGKIAGHPKVLKGFSLACGILMALLGLRLMIYF